jgi:hypothetical protein
MSLRIRRGTNAQRTGITFDLGEIVYTTDTQKLYVGDGATAGGLNVLASAAGTGLVFDQLTQTLKISGNNTVVEADTAPSLGGFLNLNGQNIIGNGNIVINGSYLSSQFSSTSVVGPSITAQRARGTGTSSADVQAGDQLNKISSQGYTNGSYKTSSLIINSVSSKFPVSSTAVPGRIDFSVADGSGNMNLALNIDADMATRFYMFSPATAQLGVYSYLSTPGGLGTYTNFGRYSGTITAPTTVSTGDRIHSLRFLGYDGTNLINGAQITSDVYGPISSGQVQANIRISCRNASGTIVATQTNTATQIQFSVMPILPTFAGTAAATAAVGVLVNGMMYYDSVTHKITACLNGAWVALA